MLNLHKDNSIELVESMKRRLGNLDIMRLLMLRGKIKELMMINLEKSIMLVTLQNRNKLFWKLKFLYT